MPTPLLKRNRGQTNTAPQTQPAPPQVVPPSQPSQEHAVSVNLFVLEHDNLFVMCDHIHEIEIKKINVIYAILMI